MNHHQPGAVFSGRHMLLTMLAFFGVIIGVNLTMAWFARSSWTGLVVENSYVASQEFNAKMEARIKEYGLSRSTVFLEQLNRKDILDIFQGLESGVVK